MRALVALAALGTLMGCDDAAPSVPPPDRALDQALPTDLGPDLALDRGLDAAPDALPDLGLELDAGSDALPDQAIVDMLIDAEPFEAGPSPFNLDAAIDPLTLETAVESEWTPIFDDTAQYKRVVISVAPEPGLALRVPVQMVAPANGCPCDFIVSHTGFNAEGAPGEALPDDAFLRWALDNRIGLVFPSVAPLPDSGPEGAAFAEALAARLAETGDVRFTALYVWGLTYIRAATAAVAEAEVFRAGRIGAHGRSRAGIAAATAVIHDARFTALNAWLTPIAKLPPDALEAPDDLRGRALRRLRFDAARMSLPALHFDALRDRRVNLFVHNGANDPQTPGLLDAEALAREFPLCIEPSLTHGPIAADGSFAQPGTVRLDATRQALFSAVYARGYRLMTPPLISHTIVNGTLTILARFRTTPRGEDGTLWYAIDRPAPGAPGYTETRWQSVAMTRFDTRTFVATLPVPAGAQHMDVFSYHSDLRNDARRYVTSGYARIEFAAP